MSQVSIASSFFDFIAHPPSTPDFSFDRASELDIFDIATGGTARALQLSSSLVRMSWTAPGWTGDTRPYEMRIAGSSLGPITSLSAFQSALDRSLARGNISSITVLHGSTTILKVTFTASTLTVATGNQLISVKGKLPTSFTQLFALETLLGQADSVDTMTSTQRSAWFTKLSAFGLSGISFYDAGHRLLNISMSATAASLSMSGHTITATGHFPSDLGQVARLLWTLSSQLDHTGTIDIHNLGGFSLSTVKVTNSAGATLLSASDLTHTAQDYIFAGHHFTEWTILDASGGADVIRGAGGTVASLLNGLDGNDYLSAYGGSDALLGGDGNDTLSGGDGNDLIYGGTGTDRATFSGSANLRIDLALTAAQVTGQGTDLLSSIENVTTSAGNDRIFGSTLGNAISAGSGNDSIDGRGGNDTIDAGAGNDTLVGGTGSDVMTGGDGADVFRFYAADGVMAEGRDQVMDFTPGLDQLTFANVGGTAPWAGMSVATFLSTFATFEEGHVVFRFGDQSALTLEGIGSTAALEGSILLI